MNFMRSASVIGRVPDGLGLGAKGVGPRLMRRLEEEVKPLKLSMDGSRYRRLHLMLRYIFF